MQPCMYKVYLESKQQNKTMMAHISEAHRQLVQCNREYIKILADTLHLTAAQNIAQRGHNEHEEGPENKDNFLEILNFLKKYDIHEKLTEATGNAKYTHHNIQNAISDILCDIILDEIWKLESVNTLQSLLMRQKICPNRSK